MLSAKFFAVGCLALLPTCAAWAGSKSWDGGGGDLSWHNPANWAPDGLPGPDDDVVIAVRGGPITVVYSAGVSTVQSLMLDENLSITGGTLNLANASVVNGVLTLAGSMGGGGDLTVNGEMNWSGGNGTQVAGTGKIIVSASGALSKTGPATLARSIDNHGTVTSTAAWFSVSVVFNNFGTFTWNVASGFASFTSNAGLCSFNNLGSFIKIGSGGGGFDANSNAQFAFNNSGTCDLDAGSLQIGTGSHSGSFEINNAVSQISFGQRGNSLSPTAIVTGIGTMHVAVAGSASDVFVCDGMIDLDGRLQFGSGAPTFNGPVAVRGTLRLGTGSNFNVTFNGAVDLLPTGIIECQGTGTVHFNGPSIDLAGSATASVAFEFANDAVITRSFNWGGTSMTGAGNLVIAPTGHMTATLGGNSPLWLGIENNGTLDLGPNGFEISNSGGIVNNAVMNFNGPAASSSTSLTGISGEFPFASIVNNGVFTKTGAGHLSFGTSLPLRPLTFINNGTFALNQGQVDFSESFTNTGDVDVVTGTALTLRASSFHDPASQLNIAGTLMFHDHPGTPTHDLMGETTVSGSLEMIDGLITLHNAITPGVQIGLLNSATLHTDIDQNWPAGLRMTSCTCGGAGGGTLTGSGVITLGGASVFRGRMAGTGETIISPGATLTTNSTTSGGITTIARTIINDGTITIDRTPIDFENGTLVNNGTLNITLGSNGTARGLAGDNSLINNGIIEKNLAGAWTLANSGSAMSLVNDGTVNINQGAFQLDCGSSGDGDIVIDANTTLRINSNCSGGSVSVAGTVLLSPQKHLALSGSYTQLSTGRLKSTILTPLSPLVTTAGPITLDGAVELLMTPTPQGQTQAKILQSGTTVSGTFASQKVQPFGGILYATDQVDWIVYRPGDLDGDDAVDINDLLIVINHWGLCPPLGACLGDSDGSGVVDLNDLLLVINNWG